MALQQIKERGALPMIDRVVDIRQVNRPLQQWSGPLPGAGYGQFDTKGRQPDCKNSCDVGERSEIDV